jgi:hypothetical protein
LGRFFTLSRGQTTGPRTGIFKFLKDFLGPRHRVLCNVLCSTNFLCLIVLCKTHKCFGFCAEAQSGKRGSLGPSKTNLIPISGRICECFATPAAKALAVTLVRLHCASERHGTGQWSWRPYGTSARLTRPFGPWRVRRCRGGYGGYGNGASQRANLCDLTSNIESDCITWLLLNFSLSIKKP